jgi:hypothetical protein
MLAGMDNDFFKIRISPDFPRDHCAFNELRPCTYYVGNFDHISAGDVPEQEREVRKIRRKSGIIRPKHFWPVVKSFGKVYALYNFLAEDEQ